MNLGTPIPVIRTPSPGEFRRRYLWPERPVVFSDFHAGAGLASVRTAKRAARVFGQVPLFINQNYYDADAASFAQYRCSLADYLALAEQDPTTSLMCTEQALAPELREAMAPNRFSDRPEYQPPVGFMFAARRGLFAPLHFDGDLRDVLFTQVFGRKRIVLMPPSVSRRLLPIGNASALSVHLLPEREKRRLLEFNDAHSCILEPGQTLFIPRLWWHYLENVDTAMSVSSRFGRTVPAAQLSCLPTSHSLQNLANQLIDRRTGALADRRTAAAIFEAYFQPAPTPRARFERFHSVLDALYAERCPDALQGWYEGGVFARREQELSAEVPYAPVATFVGDALAPVGARRLAKVRAWWGGLDLGPTQRAHITGTLGLEAPFARLTQLDEALLRQLAARAPRA